MFTLFRTLSVGHFARHGTHSVLVVVSIAVGVAALVATQALNRSLNDSIQNGVNPLSSLADLIVVRGQSGVPMGLAEQIRDANAQGKLPGVKDARPYVLNRVPVKELDNKSVWLIGVDYNPLDDKGTPGQDGDRTGLGVTIRDLYQPEAPGEIFALLSAHPALVTPGLAEQLERADPKSRRFTIRNAGLAPQLTRAGVVDFGDSKLRLRDSHVIVTDVRTAAAICFPEKPDHVHYVGVTIEDGADLEKVRKDLQEFVGDRADVQTIDASRDLVSDVSAGLEIGLTLGSAVALVVGLFLVYNILSVTVAERRHEVGILRSVGATRQQIAWLFVGEAGVLGLVGSLLGVPLGLFLAWLTRKPMADFISDMLLPIEGVRLNPSPWLLLVAVLSGTAVAILAALVPALQAAGEDPADAVRRAPRQSTFVLQMVQAAAAAIFLLLGVGSAQARDLLPTHVGMFVGVALLFVGGLTATPLLASGVGRLVQPLFRHCLGLEGRLAADNLVRSPGRSGLVIGALAATVGLLASTAGFIKSTREAVTEWIDEKIAADLFVTSGASVTSGGASLQMREDAGEKIKAVPGVAAVLPVRTLRIDYRNKAGRECMVFVIGIDTKAFREANVTAPLAKSMKRYNELGLGEPGTVLVSENFAALHKVKVGDTLEFAGGKGMIEARVAGLATDYSWNRGTIIMDLSWLREVYGDQQVDLYDVFLEPGYDAEEVREELLKRHGDEYVLFAATRPEVNREVSASLNKLYALAYAQQTIVGVVALLGVVSALFISVLQRRREMGLLRAVGCTRGQIMRTVLAEAVLMGVIGAVVGFGIGLLLEWYILKVMIFDESGFSFPLRVPWLEAGGLTLAAVVLATLAGLWPAYQATRLRITEAIAYE